MKTIDLRPILKRYGKHGVKIVMSAEDAEALLGTLHAFKRFTQIEPIAENRLNEIIKALNAGLKL